MEKVRSWNDWKSDSLIKTCFRFRRFLRYYFEYLSQFQEVKYSYFFLIMDGTYYYQHIMERDNQTVTNRLPFLGKTNVDSRRIQVMLELILDKELQKYPNIRMVS